MGETTSSAVSTRAAPGRRSPGSARRRRSIRGVALSLALVVVFACADATVASASPATDYASATVQATKLNAEIAANSRRADVLDERYLQARHAVTVAQRKIAETQRQIIVVEAHARQVRNRLGRRAALLYMGAGNGDPMGVDVANVQELGAMAQYGDAAAAQDQQLLDDVQRTDAQLTSQHDTLEGELAVAQDRRHAADTARRKVARANTTMMKLLDTTNADVKLLAAQIEQQAQAAAAVAERAWLKRLAAEQAARRKHAHGHNVSSPLPGDGGATPGNLPPPAADTLKAVAYAWAQLGKPYVYAAAGPDAFDCSGLTMMAWAQSGVLMEHGSQAQFDAFPHVPIDQLQPGDLVFFGTSGPTNHHVGIVVEPGIMIDAPHTGAEVELVSYFQSDLVPIGARPQPQK
jgi:cell wall-associated NlpC family hydrolase